MTQLPRQDRRGGFALPLTLLLLLVVSILLGATIRFVSHSARLTRIYTARSRCRLAAQSAIEDAKARIQKGFSRYTGGASGAMVKVDPRHAEAYNWFDHVSDDHLTIGHGLRHAVTLDSPLTINNCTVYVGIGRQVDHQNNAAVAKVPIVATAVFHYPDGLEVSSTIQERICFGTGQSHVFDYAYFVNNYGWMTGAGIVVNGDLRANGNVCIKQSTVNGFIYAAANEEVGSLGVIDLVQNPKIFSANYYHSRVSDRARPTDPPASSGSGNIEWYGGYDAPSRYNYYGQPYNTMTITKSLLAAQSRNYIVNQYADSIPMPFVSDLAPYVEYAQEMGGSLTYGAYSYTDSAGNVRQIDGGEIQAHYDGAGPSGNADAADNGALVLVGTEDNPVVVNGPVIVDSDVIIKGYITGQGTIYSGRNIHIVGDVINKNPPSWPHPDGNPAATRDANKGKDLVGLIAKGNVVVGDYTENSAYIRPNGYEAVTWKSVIANYINNSSGSVSKSYACDPSDANIGYDEVFNGDYTAVEAVGEKRKLRAKKIYNYPSGYSFVVEDATDRRYYESVVDDALITQLAGKRRLSVGGRWFDVTVGVSQIDAVCYNNHGNFGPIGNHQGAGFTLNGSLVSRDEALVGTYNSGGLVFNWDIRLKPDSAEGEGLALGLPVGPQEPYTCSWQEVPASLNPVYLDQANTP